MLHRININCNNETEAKNYIKRYGNIEKLQDITYEIHVEDEDGFKWYLQKNKCVELLSGKLFDEQQEEIKQLIEAKEHKYKRKNKKEEN